jgi:hypothetical protein
VGWRSVYKTLVGPIEVDHVVPPADIVPGFLPMEDTPAVVELQHQARHAALRLITAVLQEERAKAQGFRDVARLDLALEIRSILLPARVGAELLGEVPPVGIRHAEPVRERAS